jgi:hypothetical protein
LTYNATERILYTAVETRRLVCREPLEALTQVPKRWLYVTPEIAKALNGEDEQFRNFPMVQTESLISVFSAGFLIRVSLAGNSSRKPEFERLSDLDEVWAMCVRKPLMWQVRMLGRFLDAGVFIGLDLLERRQLGSRMNYQDIASKIPEKWTSVFGNTKPFAALRAESYLGGVVMDVDDNA